MAKLKLFNRDSFAGGGTFFNNGPYRLEEALFVKYDFNGKAPGKDGNGLTCLSAKLQPLDKDGVDAGEQVVQYWSVGDDAEIVDKGKSIELKGEYPTVWKLSDFAIFVDHLGKAGFDLDAMEDENDISVLNGLVGEWGKIPSPRNQSNKKKDEDGGEDKKKGPQEVVVVISVQDTTKKKGGKAAGKPAPAAGKSKPAAKDDAVDLEEVLTGFLVKDILTDKNAKGIDKLQVRMKLMTHAQKVLSMDAEAAKALAKLYNNQDTLGAILESAGWTMDANSISKAEEE